MAPPLTPRLGPWIAPTIDPETHFGEWSRILAQLGDQLPPHQHFLQAFDTSIQYWIPLSWRGFTQSTFFSFVVDPVDGMDATRQRYSKGTRSDLKKAAKRIVLADDAPIHFLHQGLEATMRRSGRRSPYSAALLASALEAAASRNQGVHLSAHDGSGEYLAGALLVWDSAKVYYLVAAATDAARGTGAQTLLVDRAIALAHEKRLRFDFEGSRIQAIEKFFRGFGGYPEPFSRVERRTHLLDIALTLRRSRT